jgi:hypothetical protein
MSSASGNMAISGEASRMLTTKVDLSRSQSGNSTSVENNFDSHTASLSLAISCSLFAITSCLQTRYDALFFRPEAIASGDSSMCTPQCAGYPVTYKSSSCGTRILISLPLMKIRPLGGGSRENKIIFQLAEI